MDDRTRPQARGEGAELAAILHCLGNFRLCAAGDGADLSPRGRKARALVAYLALSGGSVGRERLAGLLWSERGEDQARASLRNTLLELRDLSTNGRAVLTIEREHVGIVSSRLATDLGRLQTWAASGDLAAIDARLASWDGRIFADLDSIDGGFDEWLAGERTRQQEKMFAALIAALEAALGRVEHVRSIADKLLQVEPTNEVIVRLAMRADRLADDVSAIRRRYKRLEDQLRTEFNAAPSADTRRLYDDLVADSAGLSPTAQVNTAAPPISNEQIELAATGETARESLAAQGSTFLAWRRVAAAAIVATVGAAAIAVTAFYDWKSRHTIDLIELRPLLVRDEKPAFQALAQQTHGTVRRILASHQVPVIDGAATASDERATTPEFTLAGSLENSASEVSITLYLDNVQDGQTLWSHRFARSIDERERLPNEIGAHAAFMIGCALRQRRLARVKPTVAAFKIYLETCEPAFIWGDAMVLAVGERLVEVAPDDAYGHGLVAFANSVLSGAPGLTAAEVRVLRDRARRAASRALQLDPTSPLPLIVNAFALPPAESWLEREIQFRRAGTDHATLWEANVHHLRASGRLYEALRMLEACLAQAPLSAKGRTTAAVLEMQLGNHERAHLLFNEAVELWPSIEIARWYRFVNSAFYGSSNEALDILNREPKKFGLMSGEVKCWRSFIGARRANGPDVVTVRKACVEETSDYWPRMLAALGDTNGALEALDTARMDWDGATISFFYPEMKNVRHDVRFMSVIAESGLVGLWATTGQWPDFCSDKDLPYSCKDAAAEVLKRSAQSVKPQTRRPPASPL